MSQSNNTAANLKLVKSEALTTESEVSVPASSASQLSPGEMLKQAREQKEFAISTIGKQLKLDNRSVEALERNEFDSIGAPVFVKGHLRKYASLVDIEPNDIMFAYHQIARAQDTTPVISQTTPMTAKRPKMEWLGKLLTRLVLVALLAALAYGLYQLWQWYLADAKSASDEATTELNVPATENTVSLPSREDVVAVSSTAGNVATSLGGSTIALPPAPANLTNTEPQQLPEETAITSEPTTQTQQVPSSAQGTEMSSSAATNPVSNVGDQLRLVFTDNCWVRIRDEDGKSLMNGIAYAGNQKQFTLTGSTEIELGNADGVQLYLNGETYQIPSGAQRGNKAHFRLVPKS